MLMMVSYTYSFFEMNIKLQIVAVISYLLAKVFWLIMDIAVPKFAKKINRNKIERKNKSNKVNL